MKCQQKNASNCFKSELWLCRIKVIIVEAKCVVNDLLSLEDAVSFWQETGSALSRLSEAELIT